MVLINTYMTILAGKQFIYNLLRKMTSILWNGWNIKPFHETAEWISHFTKRLKTLANLKNGWFHRLAKTYIQIQHVYGPFSVQN